MIAFAKSGHVVEVIHAVQALALFEILNADGSEALRAAIRKRVKNTVVHHAENNGGSADAEREGENGHRREARFFSQLPDGKAEIGEDAMHTFASVGAVSARSGLHSERWRVEWSSGNGAFKHTLHFVACNSATLIRQHCAVARLGHACCPGSQIDAARSDAQAVMSVTGQGV